MDDTGSHHNSHAFPTWILYYAHTVNRSYLGRSGTLLHTLDTPVTTLPAQSCSTETSKGNYNTRTGFKPHAYLSDNYD